MIKYINNNVNTTKIIDVYTLGYYHAVPINIPIIKCAKTLP